MLSRIRKIAFWVCLLLSLTGAGEAAAQSLDARAPSPVRRNEIVGRIGARDLGDSRLTDHFYTFAGTPGDVLITIETQNLNGDIDVFTAGSLRPVLKLALYAELTNPVTKNIYLRQREELILRIEARTPNDDDGIYRIRFSGSFEPIAAAAGEAEETAASVPANRKGKRVSSVGARIEDPTPPPVDVPASSSAERTSTTTEDPSPLTIKKEPVAEPTPRTARNTRTRPAASPRRTTIKPAAPSTEKETASKPVTTNGETETIAETKPEPTPAKTTSAPRRSSTSARNRNSKRNTPVVTPAEKTSTPTPTESTEAATPLDPAAALEELRNSKLIIELLDGTRYEKPMLSIRRVSVENGHVIVVERDGKIERIRLSTVVKMSIGP
jgi:hypothetical protein